MYSLSLYLFLLPNSCYLFFLFLLVCLSVYFYPILFLCSALRFGLCFESDLLPREARGYQEGCEEKARSGTAHLPAINPFPFSTLYLLP
jgi:hypothetical protein